MAYWLRCRLLAPLLAAACAIPVTQTGTVSESEVLAERSRQLQLALRGDLAMQQRLDDVAYPLLQSAALFCGPAARPRTGLRLGNVAQYRADWAGAARALGYTDTLEVFHVPPGSAAERSGVRAGDRVVRIEQSTVPTGSQAVPAASGLIEGAMRMRPGVALGLGRPGSPEFAVTVAADTACAYDVVIERSGSLNAYADGRRIFITTAMLRFVPDDEELAFVLAHEIAHNAMRHLDAQKRNVILGALFGAVVDIAAAANGYNSQGQFAKSGAEVGAQIFSQDFEREADYVGMYILALAGQPFENAANVWRRMAVENPGTIKFGTTHPTTAERFVRLEQWSHEIEGKLAAGKPLVPATRNGRIALNPLIATTPRRRLPKPVDVASRSVTSAGSSASLSPRAVDASSSGGRLSTPSAAEASAAALAAATVAPPLPTRVVDPNFAEVTVSVPRSDSARAAATVHFAAGQRYMQRGEWLKARASLEQALELDASVAAYHVARGDVMQMLGELADAEASFGAAVLIAPSNREHQRKLAEVRRLRQR